MEAPAKAVPRETRPQRHRALETPFESLINWIISQAIKFPSGQIHPSLPDGAPQLVHEMGPWDVVGLETRRGSACLKCPFSHLHPFEAGGKESGDGAKTKR